MNPSGQGLDARPDAQVHSSHFPEALLGCLGPCIGGGAHAHEPAGQGLDDGLTLKCVPFHGAPMPCAVCPGPCGLLAGLALGEPYDASWVEDCREL